MEKSCGAVVCRIENGTALYLLLHYQREHWDFPKGHVERGEGEEETARREIIEETGIGQLEFVPDFRERVEYSFMREGKKVPKEVIFFLAKTKEIRVRLSHEHIGFSWLPYSAAKKRATYENAKMLLDKASDRLSSSQ